MTMTSLMKFGPTQLHKCKMKSLWKLMMMLKFLTMMWNRKSTRKRKRKSKTNDPYEIKKINYVLWEVIVYIGVNGCRGESSFYFYFL